MDILLTNGFIDHVPGKTTHHPGAALHGNLNGRNGFCPAPMDQAFLRHCGWEIGEARSADAYTPGTNHVALASVTSYQGFAHWRILTPWVEQAAWQKGDAWHHCRLVLRLYDVSLIEFNGFNAHQIIDHDLPGLCGQFFFKLPRPGTWQLAEVGFRLKNGEFVPAARSDTISFPRESVSPNGSHAALLVDKNRRIEHIGNLWEQERILRERQQPRLRRSLRCASFAFASLVSGQDGSLAKFVSELAAGQQAQGHEAHVFVPATDQLREDRELAGVHYHPLPVRLDGTPLDQAQSFSQVAEERLRELPPFDVVHLHEWMTGIGSMAYDQPTIRSLSSIEATRRGDAPATELSLAIEEAEREAIRSVSCLLTPPWLRDRARAELGLNGSLIHPFPMEGRLPNEWETPLDIGQVKSGIGFGPMDRLLLFVGPLEYSAGVDLLIESLPVVLGRCGNLRVAFVGGGMMYGHLQHRAHQVGVAHAIRLLSHVEGPALTRLLRAAEALVLPSRWRVPQDDAVVDLARRAGKPVVTTHAGPAHLIRHEENGIITYDNPGSMVWAIDRIVSDPGHAERMGQNGMRKEDSSIRWSDVARCYLELCAAQFPQLSELSC